MSVGVGIVGMGVMGRTHAASYVRVARHGVKCELRGIYSRTLGEGGGNLAELAGGVVLPDTTIRHDSLDALLADEQIEVVSVCTHTDTHVEIATRALTAGKHVLVEKPVALTTAEVRRLEHAASAAGRLCMPAMCMRFWPGWPWLREHVRLGTFGAVQSARFERLGEPPAWSAEFYRDAAKSGSALFDLHIHDVDFLLWCFGPPASVRATGWRQHVVACFDYGSAPSPVEIEGGWVGVPGFGFRMRYRVVFDDAVAEFRHGERQPLLLTQDGETRPIPLSTESAYDAQVRHLLTAVRSGRTELRATLEDAARATSLLEAELAQLEAGR